MLIYNKNYSISTLFVFSSTILILFSSFVFSLLTSSSVFDERYHLIDIERYIKMGINYSSIYLQTTPTGPGSHMWSSIWGKILSNSIFSIRLSVWVCWVFICIIYYNSYNQAKGKEILFTILFVFSNPYIPILSGTVMTEGFAIMCILISLFLIEKTILKTDKYIYLLLTISGFFMGLAIISRLYYLSIFPSAVFSFLVYNQRTKKKLSSLFILIGSAIIPILILYLIWGSITPPLYNKGEVFKNQRVEIGINILRPISVLMYFGIYTFPFFEVENIKKIPKIAYIISILFSIILTSTMYIWRLNPTHGNTGIIDALITFFHNKSIFLGYVVNFLVSFLSLLGVFLLIEKIVIISNRNLSFSKTFSIFLLFFFTVQQLFISGNIPFYDRYLIHIIPFLGLIIFTDRIYIDRKTILIVLVFICMGQYGLWRWYFI